MIEAFRGVGKSWLTSAYVCWLLLREHLAVTEQHPNLDIRFVFSNANARISKKPQTTYATILDVGPC